MAQIRCYRCGSLNVDVSTTVNSDYSVKKGLLGRFLFGAGGSVMGVNGKKTEKVTYHCKDCGEMSSMCMGESLSLEISKAIKDNDKFKLQFYKKRYNNIEWEEKKEINNLMTDLESETDEFIVELEQGIKEVCKDCFSKYTISKITKVIIPSTVETIKKETFKGFENLNEISIDALNSELTTIEDYAFSDCTNLTCFDLPHRLQKIGEGAFYNCTNFEFFAITRHHKNIKEIGRYAFNNSGLINIYISNFVEKIGKHAFPSSVYLLRFDVPAKFKSEESEEIFDTANVEDCKKMLQYDLIKI
ncbi:MAG: leucine-rich repeat domain-containing protein [Clostridiales bacterium]|nr:leucine-rich repeat domain-containing protein [Clostridiales bacterium]